MRSGDRIEGPVSGVISWKDTSASFRLPGACALLYNVPGSIREGLLFVMYFLLSTDSVSFPE